MTSVVKNKTLITVPVELQKKAGMKPGDILEFEVVKGIIVIRVAVLPDADDEYTPRQRKIIDARLDHAEQEIREGRVSPAYGTAKAFAAAIKADAKKLKKTK